MDNNNLKTEQDEKASCSTTLESTESVIDFVTKLPEHFAYCIFVAIRCTLKYIILIGSFLVELKKHYVNSSKTLTGRLTFNHVERDIGNLSKLPKHMSFVINENVGTDTYCDLANLVVWTIAMGIPYISLYDRHGEIYFFTGLDGDSY